MNNKNNKVLYLKEGENHPRAKRKNRRWTNLERMWMRERWGRGANQTKNQRPKK